MLSLAPLQTAGNPFIRDFLLVVLGGVLAVGGNYFIHKFRRRDQRRDLRSALITEMNSVEVLDDWVENYPHQGKLHAPAIDTIPRDVYRNSTHRLGLLSGGERTEVIEYYSQAEIVAQHIEMLNRLADEGDHGAEDYNIAHGSAAELRDRRDAAVKALRGEI